MSYVLFPDATGSSFSKKAKHSLIPSLEHVGGGGGCQPFLTEGPFLMGHLGGSQNIKKWMNMAVF